MKWGTDHGTRKLSMLVYAYLETMNRVSVPELAKRYNVSVKTAGRYIATYNSVVSPFRMFEPSGYFDMIRGGK
jgi:predicted DNA-binding transcriptional regulator YafY